MLATSCRSFLSRGRPVSRCWIHVLVLLCLPAFAGCGGGGGSSSDTTPPTAPADLVASQIHPTSLTLTWSASSDDVGVAGYEVYGGATVIGSFTGTPADLTGLTAGTPYTFTVKARDAAGNVSDASNAVEVTTPTTSTP